MSAASATTFIVFWLMLSLSASAAALPRSASLSLAEVFEAALENAPEQVLTAAYRNAAESQRAVGSGWTAGQSAVELAYSDGRPLGDRGLSEFEAGLQFTLWRPGGRHAARALGQAMTQRSDRFTPWLSWITAGRVRELLSEMAEADLQLESSEAAATAAADLLALSNTLHASGVIAERDLLLAEYELLNRQRDQRQAQARLSALEQAYRQLTGLEQRPAKLDTESWQRVDEIPEQHPLLQLLRAELQIADAAISDAEQQARGNPQLQLGMRREREPGPGPHLDSAVVSLSLPLPSRRHSAAGTAAAYNDRADAQLALSEETRTLWRQLTSIAEQLQGVDEELALSERQLALATRQREMAEQAFRMGEIDSDELIRRLHEALSTGHARARLQLQRQQLISQYNHLTGVLP